MASSTTTRSGEECSPAGRGGGHGLQRRRHAAHPVELDLVPVSGRARQSQRSGGQEPDVSSRRFRARRVRGTPGQPQRPRRLLHSEQGVLRDRSFARLRARLHHADLPRPGPSQHCAAGYGTGTIPWGPGHHEAFEQTFRPRCVHRHLCEDLPDRNTTRSRWIPSWSIPDGIPAAEDHLPLSDNSQKMLDHGLARAEEAATRRGRVDGRKLLALLRQPAGICSAPRAWATTHRPRWSTPGDAATM